VIGSATATSTRTAPSAAAQDVEALLAKASSENFPVALRVLPRENRERLGAVYGFARLVDDIGDLVAGDRLALLDWLEGDLARAYDGRAEHPLLQRLTPLVRELDVPREPFLRLIEANRRDQRQTRYETFDELCDYCTLSANPIGELVLRIFGVLTRPRLQLSDSVCTALQLAEHWQDVGEDYARGRIYLPLEDLRRFGVTVQDLEEAQPSGPFRELMAFEVDRARTLLREGVALVASLRGYARLAIAAYVAGGRAALGAVECSGYDVLAHSPSAGTGRRVAALASVLREAR
jgi:squalene synthase HpnC